MNALAIKRANFKNKGLEQTLLLLVENTLPVAEERKGRRQFESIVLNLAIIHKDEYAKVIGILEDRKTAALQARRGGKVKPATHFMNLPEGQGPLVRAVPDNDCPDCPPGIKKPAGKHLNPVSISGGMQAAMEEVASGEVEFPDLNEGNEGDPQPFTVESLNTPDDVYQFFHLERDGEDLFRSSVRNFMQSYGLGTLHPQLKDVEKYAERLLAAIEKQRSE
jgi:hypothetical protein